MSEPIVKPISRDDRKRWEQQNLSDLLRSANLPFTDKIRMLENMEAVAQAFHSKELPHSTDEHEGLQR